MTTTTMMIIVIIHLNIIIYIKKIKAFRTNLRKSLREKGIVAANLAASAAATRAHRSKIRHYYHRSLLQSSHGSSTSSHTQHSISLDNASGFLPHRQQGPVSVLDTSVDIHPPSLVPVIITNKMGIKHTQTHTENTHTIYTNQRYAHTKQITQIQNPTQSTEKKAFFIVWSGWS